MKLRLGILAAAIAGFAALSAPAMAASATDGRLVVAQNIDVRIGGDRPRVRERQTVRVRERRMMHRGPERCRVTVVRERRPNGRIVERRTRRCR